MKFLSWLFNASQRHRSGIRNYEKGGVGNRIFIIAMYLILFAGTIGLELWALNLFNDNFFTALLVILFLFIPVALSTVEFGLVYGVCGIKMAIWGLVFRKNEIEEVESDGSKKNYKAFDAIIGVLGFIIAIGIIIAIIYIFSKNA